MRTVIAAVGALATLASLLVVAPAWHVAATPVAPGPAPPPEQPPFSWPLRPDPPVTRPFDPPGSQYGAGHRGVDLAAAPGAAVFAAADGVVVFAGVIAGRGVISIQHGVLRTTYEPVLTRVVTGDRVTAGQRVATLALGHEGCPNGCLHWGVRRGGDPPEYLDPLLLVATGSLRLKPWDG